MRIHNRGAGLRPKKGGGFTPTSRDYESLNTYLTIGGASSLGGGGIIGGAFGDSDFDDDNPLEKEIKMPCPPICGPLSVLRNIPKLYV